MAFAAVLLMHLLYDFHWQGPFIAEMKGKSWFLLGVHALTWALLVWFVCVAFDVGAPWKLFMLFATHYAIDAWKARYSKLDSLGAGLWVDQAAHVVTLALAVWA